MLISRRLRATIVMMLLWGLCTSLLGALLAAVAWFAGAPRGARLGDVLPPMVALFGFAGVIAGAGFSAILVRRGESADKNALPKRESIKVWMAVGAGTGLLINLAYMLLNGSAWALTHPLAWKGAWIGTLSIGAILGLFGGIVGGGILAIARRGKVLPGEAEHALLKGPSQGAVGDDSQKRLKAEG